MHFLSTSFCAYLLFFLRTQLPDYCVSFCNCIFLSKTAALILCMSNVYVEKIKFNSKKKKTILPVAILDLCKLEWVNPSQKVRPISGFDKCLSKVICAKFGDFLQK